MSGSNEARKSRVELRTPGLVMAFLTLLSMPTIARLSRAELAHQDDSRWQDGLHKTGFDSRVYAFTIYDAALIAAGQFTRAGGTVVDLLAQWDGAHWNQLGGGLSVGTQARAVTTFENGLVVGGHFSRAGDIAVRNIASWDGARWHAMGSGFNGYVLALCAYHDTLIAGGTFTEADGTPAGGIAFWDGTSWHPMTSGVSGGSGWVNALVVYKDVLVLAGNFTEVAGVAAHNIAFWNGAHAGSLGTGTSSQVEALAIFGEDLIVAGYFQSAGGRYVGGIATWNGSEWRSIGGVGGSAFPGVASLAAHEGTLFIGGNFTEVGSLSEGGGIPASNVASWDGSTWRALGNGTSTGNKYLVPLSYAIQPFGGEVYFGGEFLFAGGLYTPAIARWNGASWLSVSPGQGVPGSIYDIEPYDGRMAVAGTFPWAGDEMNCKHVALWNGRNWEGLDSGVDSLALAVHELDGDLIVGGNFLHASQVAASRVACWNGTNWHAMGDGFDGTVWDLVDRAGILYAGGDFTRSGSVELNHVAQWDGISWRPLGAGLDETVLKLAVYRDTLIAGGNFSFSGPNPVRHIAKWNGNEWQPMDDGLSLSVRALATFRGDLFAGGLELGVSGTLFRWNGSIWENLTGNDSDVLEINSLHVLNDRLFSGGVFRSIAGTPVENVARWDGASWSALGSGTNNLVFALSGQGGSLFVGGGFSVAGGKGSSGLAIWEEIPSGVEVDDFQARRTTSGIKLSWRVSRLGLADIVALHVQRAPTPTGPYEDRTALGLDPRESGVFEDRNVNRESAYCYRLVLSTRGRGSTIVGPLCVEPLASGESDMGRILQVAPGRDGIQIRYHLEVGPVPVELSVFDVRGRSVIRFQGGIQTAGDYTRIWDRRDSKGKNVAQGSYLVQLEAGQLRASAKLLVVK